MHPSDQIDEITKDRSQCLLSGEHDIFQSKFVPEK